MAKYLSTLILLLSTWVCTAQDSVWTLQRCIAYTIGNNIDISQSALNERLSKLQLQQSQLSQLPNASLSGSYGYNFGRSVDPTSNQFVNSNYAFSGLSGNVDVLLFGWFQKRRKIEQNKLLLQAASADFEQIKDDASLNVATGYLRVLLAKEQVAIANSQLKLSQQQREQTQAFVDAGSKPELDLEQMKAQVAADSVSFITAQSNVIGAILDMKALMNLDMATPFDVANPDINKMSFNEAMDNTPQSIYQTALDKFASIKSAKIKEQAASKGWQAAKAALWPQLALGAQLGSNYASSLKEYTDVNIVGSTPTGNFVNVNGTDYNVMQPTLSFSQHTIPFFKQLKNNFRQSVALSVTVPLFNGWVAQSSVRQADIERQSKTLQVTQSERKLQQDVFKAHNDAQTAVHKYFASLRTAEAAQKAYNYALKRYELGMLNSVELLNTQNTSLKSQIDVSSAKYDMVFKLKVIDYYLGKEIEL